MSVPTDFGGLVAWHEADSEPGADGSAPSELLGLGGTANSQTQADAARRPVLGTNATTGRRYYRFDNADDGIILSLASSAVAPCTIFVVYSPVGLSTSRVLAGEGGTNWLLAPRADLGLPYKYMHYMGAFVPGNVATIGDVTSHSVRHKLVSPRSEFRVNGIVMGTAEHATVPGVMSVGLGPGSFGERANADVYAIVVYNTDLSDGDMNSLEWSYLLSFLDPAPHQAPLVTQMVVESVADADAKVRLSQMPIEVITDADSKNRLTTLAVEVITDANPKNRVSQFVIELVFAVKPMRSKPQYHPQIVL